MASSSPLMSLGASAPIHRGLWIISNGACSTCTNNDDFHLLIVRSGMSQNSKRNGGDCRKLPVGFVLHHHQQHHRELPLNLDMNANNPVDNLTTKNIVLSIQEEGGELGKFVISYDQLLSREMESLKSILSQDIRQLVQD